MASASSRRRSRPRSSPPRLRLGLLALVACLAAFPRLASARLFGGGGVSEDLSDERLIGWKGETYDSSSGSSSANPAANPATHLPAGSGVPLSDDPSGDLRRGYWMEPVSWYPRAFHLHNVMSPEECDELLELARPRVRRSTVIDSVTGESKIDPIRTSEQCFLNRGKFPLVTMLENRLARITMLPPYHGEDLQVLKYGVGQKYDAHHDVGELDSKSGAQLAAEGGHRVATVLLYLTDVEEGGETAFPDSEWIDPTSGDAKGPWSDCAVDRVAVKPKKGDGLLFWSITPENKIDQRSMHAGCPVIRGEKWTATKWIHARPFRWTAPPPPAAPPGCENKREECKGWANAGECEKNPGFMLEDCRWACKACEGMQHYDAWVAQFGGGSEKGG